MYMTENLKNTLKIILNCYKDDKMNEEEALTLLEGLINQNTSGSNIITYPITVPSEPYWWWDKIRYQPYCTTSTTTFDTAKEQYNEQQNTVR
jgi:hypothetical protein